MTTTEKVLLGISAVSICASGFCCYMWLAYKEAVDILVAERDESFKRPFMGFVCENKNEKGGDGDV